MGTAPGQALYSFIKDQQEQARQNNVIMNATVITFDDKAEKIFSNKDIQSISISEEEAQELMTPGNTTRLYATAIEALAAQRKRAARLRKLHPDAECAFVNTLFTDGMDNESHPFTPRDLNEAVKAARADGIVCIFAGANQDAVATGTQYGYNAGTCLTMSSAPAHVANALRCVSSAVTRASSGGDAGFTQLERAVSAPASKHAHQLDAVTGQFLQRHLAVPASSLRQCGGGSKTSSCQPVLRCNGGPPSLRSHNIPCNPPLLRQNALRARRNIQQVFPIPLPVLRRQVASTPSPRCPE